MTGNASVVLAGDLGDLPEKLRESGVKTAGESRDPEEALSLALSMDVEAIVASVEAAFALAGRLGVLDPSDRPVLIAVADRDFGASKLLGATICSDAAEITAVAEKTYRSSIRRDPSLRAEISGLLERLCLPTGRSAHRYVMAALLMMASEPDLSGLEPEVLYPRLARRFNVPEERVSAALDFAVRTVWRRCDAQTLSQIFHTASRPAAEDFLKVLFGCLYGKMGRSIWGPLIY